MFAAECNETVYNPFKFTGQWYDSEIGQYYLRARMYDPQLMRFTSRDPVKGKFQKPMTLHPYLYCGNDSINKIDPSGELSAGRLVSSILTGSALYAHGIELASYAVASKDWRFFELAEATFEFMPVGMAVASVGVRTGAGYIVGNVMGFGIEQLSHITGMKVLGGIGMEYWSYLLYASYILNERAELGILPGDMDNFIEWRGFW